MTTISLQKGSVVNLSKANESVSLAKKGVAGVLKNLHIGLGWDVHRSIDVDLDGFIVQVDADGQIIDTVYFGKLHSTDRAIYHTGDNLTGAGEGDDEVIKVALDKLNPRTHKLYVAVNIYQARIKFDEIDNAFMRIANADTNDELIHYNLSKVSGPNYSVILGEVVKEDDGTWSFGALGLVVKDRSIGEVKNRIERGNVEGATPANPTLAAQQGTEPPKKKGILGRLFG